MQWAAVAILALAAVVLAQDECGPPPMGQNRAGPSDCCGVRWTPSETFKNNFQTCRGKYSGPHKPPGPPPTDGVRPTPDPAMRNQHACMEECVFSESGLLTADKMLEKTAVTQFFANNTDPTTMTAAVEKCFGTYKADIDPSFDCKSGASEFKQCVMRELFLSCPAAKWTESADCTELKARIAKCPKMPVHMGDRRGMHHH